MTAVLSACIFKTISKLVTFAVAIFILKMEENKQRFHHSRLYYFKNGENTTGTQRKRLAPCVEKVLWGTECVTVVCRVSCWSFLSGRCSVATRLVGVSGNKIKTLIENNQCYSTGEIADILKISKSMKLLVKMQSVSFYFMEKTK